MPFSKSEALAVATYVAKRFEIPANGLMPVVTDFFVFGSTVKEGVLTVNDLDLCAFYIEEPAKDAMSLPDYLCEIEKEMWKQTTLPRVPIDFIVLQHSVLWDPSMRYFYGMVFKDSNFVENMLARLLRWNVENGTFEVTSGTQLIQQYEQG